MPQAQLKEEDVIVSQEPVTIELGENFTARMSEAYRSSVSLTGGDMFDSVDDPTVRIAVDGIEANWTIRSFTRYSHGSSYDFLLTIPVDESLFDQNIYLERMIRLVLDRGQRAWFASMDCLTVLNLDVYQDYIADVSTRLPLKKLETAV